MSTEITEVPIPYVGKRDLKEILSPLSPKQRLYILYRICDLDVTTAKSLANVKQSSYNLWCNDHEKFVPIHRMLPRMHVFKEQAFQMLRRRTQLSAIILEEKIIEKILDEVKRSRYNILKTRIAQSVYDKLINALDIQPQVHLSWSERAQGLQEYLKGGNNHGTVIEANYCEQTEYPQGNILSEREQVTVEAKTGDEERLGGIVGQSQPDGEPPQDS